MADRFYYEGPLDRGDVTVDGPEAHHLVQVRRFAAGDAVTLFNGDGREYLGQVVEVRKKQVLIAIAEVASTDRELGFVLHIASAMPKGDRGDFLIEKLTELGVTDFTPLHTERSVVKVDEGKVEKLRRAVLEASKQCGRNRLLRVHPPVVWSDWCGRQEGDRWLAHPGVAVTPAVTRGDRLIAIGPEGGFSEAEVQLALSAGWRAMSLGPRILRVETAALVVASRHQ